MSLNLELTSVTQRNVALQADNASLLQRWIDKMNLTADEMNQEFEKEAAEQVKPDGDDGPTGAAKGKAKAGAEDFRMGGKT